MDITEAVGSQSVIARRPRSARITGFGRSGHSFFSERTTDPGSGAVSAQMGVRMAALRRSRKIPTARQPTAYRYVSPDGGHRASARCVLEMQGAGQAKR